MAAGLAAELAPVTNGEGGEAGSGVGEVATWAGGAGEGAVFITAAKGAEPGLAPGAGAGAGAGAGVGAGAGAGTGAGAGAGAGAGVVSGMGASTGLRGVGSGPGWAGMEEVGTNGGVLLSEGSAVEGEMAAGGGGDIRVLMRSLKNQAAAADSNRRMINQRLKPSREVGLASRPEEEAGARVLEMGASSLPLEGDGTAEESVTLKESGPLPD
ncbi:MAG: hypothetical protein JWL81_2063 [Verrucomicrobiales bacterium]|nr:hypothetical protein [Verrucomicrobiales bacterium]